jgi:hypothetical protein
MAVVAIRPTVENCAGCCNEEDEPGQAGRVTASAVCRSERTQDPQVNPACEAPTSDLPGPSGAPPNPQKDKPKTQVQTAKLGHPAGLDLVDQVTHGQGRQRT